MSVERVKVKKLKYSSSCTHLRAIRDISVHAITVTRCYLPTDTSKRTTHNSSQKECYSVNLPRRDGRLS